MSAPARRPALVLLRGGLAAWLVGWFVLWRILGVFYTLNVHLWPVDHPFFPRPLVDPFVASAAYFAPLGLGFFLVRPTFAAMRVAALIAVGCAALLLLHVDSYNDATFLASFWLGLWLLWLTAQGERDDAVVVEEASALLVAIGAFLFLGGVVGKLHAEWWSGEVMHHVLFERRTFWFYPWMRDHVPVDAQLLVARWASRAALGSEMVAVTTPLLPVRWGLAVLIATALGVITCAGWTLASVLGGLIGSAAVCLWLLHRTPAPA